MTYIPHSPKERDEMLKTIGVEKLEDLFLSIPAAHRYPDLDLPPALTEMEAAAELAEIALAGGQRSSESRALRYPRRQPPGAAAGTGPLHAPRRGESRESDGR